MGELTFDEAIDEAISMLERLRPERGKNLFPLSFIQAVEPISPRYSELNDLQDVCAAHGLNAKTTDLDRPLDVSVMVPRGDAVGSFFLQRIRSVRAGDCRGELIIPTPRIVQVSTARVQFGPSGIYGTDRYYLGAPSDESRWIWAGPQKMTRRREWEAGKQAPMVAAAVALQFARQYQWTVEMSYSDRGLPLLFPTDPVGAREAFRLRDIPEGRARRAAIRHWVVNHYRRKHSDPTAEVEVRAHLRGATTFVWNGLNCTITPSADDLRRAEIAKQERHATMH
jgi:hypothetical protein